ncbi:MAG: pyridoxamine 5'-phosphate oxidase [Legionella sp.]|nr:pyridoxamine 5'-phosphate oxidase [Legionella sp.]
MNQFSSFGGIRRNYGKMELNEDSIQSDPIIQFELWFKEILQTDNKDPTAMVLSTVDEQGHPDSRVVLLKGLHAGNFFFFTNYQSTKAIEISNNPYAALNFFWPQLLRQIRVRGKLEKTSPEESDDYFYSRPLISQLSAIISPQSRKIASRIVLDKALAELVEKNGQNPVVRPEHWGGYKLCADTFEFWQGRDNRMHDRVQYIKDKEVWVHHWLAP